MIFFQLSSFWGLYLVTISKTSFTSLAVSSKFHGYYFWDKMFMNEIL